MVAVKTIFSGARREGNVSVRIGPFLTWRKQWPSGNTCEMTGTEEEKGAAW